jgi:hypothetical protein
MGTAGAIAALLKREKEGGSYHVTVSLTRNAMWHESLGLIPPADRTFADNYFKKIWTLTPDKIPVLTAEMSKWRLAAPEVVIRETPLGQLRRLAPAVKYSATPAFWMDPILRPRGSDKPEWLS